MLFLLDFKPGFPLQSSPLVNCITNQISIEMIANSLLYVGAKPIMAAHIEEQDEVIQAVDALFINLARLPHNEATHLVHAAKRANSHKKPVVVDLVGYGVSQFRNSIGDALVDLKPAVVKGNMSEMRAFCKLKSHGRGVDAGEEDTKSDRLEELIDALKDKTRTYENTVFLATGPVDIIVSKDHVVKLSNGVEYNGQFTGTGDTVGALVAANLGSGLHPVDACINGVSYFNICGEVAAEKSRGLNEFRFHLLNELSLLKDTDWTKEVKGEYV